MEVRKWILWIPPQTRVEIRDDETWMLKVTDAYLIAYGKARHEKEVLAKKKKPKAANYYILRKRRMMKWLNYKVALKAVADLEKFVFPEEAGYFKFFIEMPPSWSKKKKNRMEFEMNKQRPDATNFFKACEDSILKEDSGVCDYRVSKFWTSGRGHIEVTIGELPPANGYTKIYREDKIK